VEFKRQLSVASFQCSTAAFTENWQLTTASKRSDMIESLKSDEIVTKVGGRFKLTALLQKRILELMDGARPLVERGNMSDLEVAIQEVIQDKLAIDYPASGLDAPTPVTRG
jgi:DNA-directed RNA polymerase subunit omega